MFYIFYNKRVIDSKINAGKIIFLEFFSAETWKYLAE